jgi:hypothetical protein
MKMARLMHLLVAVDKGAVIGKVARIWGLRAYRSWGGHWRGMQHLRPQLYRRGGAADETASMVEEPI